MGTLSLSLLIGALSVFGAAAPVVRTTAELSRCMLVNRMLDQPFEIEGKITYIRTTDQLDSTVFAIEDDSAAAIVVRRPQPKVPETFGFRIGDVVRVAGQTKRFDNGKIIARCTSIALIRHDEPPTPRALSATELLSGRQDFRLARFAGSVRDAFRSRTNPVWTILVVVSDGETVYVSFPHKDKSPEFFTSLIGAKIALTGMVVSEEDGSRIRIGRTFKCSGPDALEIIQPASEGPTGHPDISAIGNLRPAEIAQLDRHRAAGDVIAVWHGDQALLRTANDELVGLELSQADTPAFGERIEAVGFPESDLYHINLSRAIWRSLSSVRTPPATPSDTSAARLMTDNRGRLQIDTTAHGRAIRLRGIVRGLPGVGNDNGLLYLEDGAYVVPVDVSANKAALKDITLGCMLEVAGTCVLNIDSWRPNAVFPRINGFTVVVRTPADIRVLARPPWWTPGRFAAVTVSLLALLLGFGIWNRILNRLVNRRSRELFKEQVAHYGADLRVEERTRLAVELHDSLAQNLTGVAMELETAEQFADGAVPELRRHLGLAARSLDSSRAELRNCLWDLRNQALEEKDMAKAVEWTLLPHVKGIALCVDFNVPRSLFSDKTAHAILSVIRELAVNGIRHGGAKSIAITGRLADGELTLTVADDGCGFDPDDCPGVLDGHFGLQGVRERLRPLGGSLAIDSAPGRGTAATVAVKAVQDEGSKERKA